MQQIVFKKHKFNKNLAKERKKFTAWKQKKYMMEELSH